VNDWLHTVWSKVTGDDRVNIPVEDLIGAIGEMSLKGETPDESVVDALSWRMGYRSAVSDLIAELWPNAEGGRRPTIEEVAR